MYQIDLAVHEYVFEGDRNKFPLDLKEVCQKSRQTEYMIGAWGMGCPQKPKVALG
jgi:hypothetical protein